MDDTEPPFTEFELATVFADMSPKKAPGEDGLTSDICAAAHRANSTLLTLFNRCSGTVGLLSRAMEASDDKDNPEAWEDQILGPQGLPAHRLAPDPRGSIG